MNIPKTWLTVYTDIYCDQSTPIPSIFMQGTRSDFICCTVRVGLYPDEQSNPKRLKNKLRLMSEMFTLYLTCDCDGLIDGNVCDVHLDASGSRAFKD